MAAVGLVFVFGCKVLCFSKLTLEEIEFGYVVKAIICCVGLILLSQRLDIGFCKDFRHVPQIFEPTKSQLLFNFHSQYCNFLHHFEIDLCSDKEFFKSG